MAGKKLILISEQILQRNALAFFLATHTEYSDVEEYECYPKLFLRPKNIGVCLYLIDARLSDSHLSDIILNVRENDNKVAIIDNGYNKERLIELLPLNADAYLTLDIPQNEFIKYLERVDRNERVIIDSLIPLMVAKLSGPVDQKSLSLKHNSLTTREKQILTLLTEGYTNNQIANELVISVYTVKNHVHNLLEKLGYDNRTQLVSYALTGGLLS